MSWTWYRFTLTKCRITPGGLIRGGSNAKKIHDSCSMRYLNMMKNLGGFRNFPLSYIYDVTLTPQIWWCNQLYWVSMLLCYEKYSKLNTTFIWEITSKGHEAALPFCRSEILLWNNNIVYLPPKLSSRRVNHSCYNDLIRM